MRRCAADLFVAFATLNSCVIWTCANLLEFNCELLAIYKFTAKPLAPHGLLLLRAARTAAAAAAAVAVAIAAAISLRFDCCSFKIFNKSSEPTGTSH